jgi:hypothetical protein
MNRLGTGCVVLALAWAAHTARAEEPHWSQPAPAPAVNRDLGVTLGIPVPVVAAPRLVQCQAIGDPLLGPPPPPPPPPPGGAPVGPATNDERYNCGQVTRTSGSGGFFERSKEAVAGVPEAFGGLFQGGNSTRGLFQSDHAFDCFCEPVSNPFLMRDPRALTEIKPLLVYQQVPGSNPAFAGGHVWFYGVQGSVAIFDWLSLDVPKLGAMTIEPHTNAAGLHNSTGFAELILGPKFTVIRNESTQTLLALGLNFDIATGGSNVVQDTGDLSLVPYVSFGQGFGKSSWGRFNFINTTGFSVATDNQRTDYFFTSLHLDYNVANLNKFFPLIEVNWFHYTNNGGSNKYFGFEGADLINFGSGGVAGHNDVSLALGLRYKFSEWLQFGFAGELPLVSNRDLMNYRLGFDVIFRY